MTLKKYFVRHLGYRLSLAHKGEMGILSDFRQFLPLWTADRDALASRKLVALTLTFYRDKRTTEIRRAQDLLFSHNIGVYPGAKRAWVWGASSDAWRRYTVKSRIRNALSERAIFFHSHHGSDTNIEAFLQKLNKHRPEVIMAYPNMLAVLAKYARDHKISLHPVPKVVVTAESVHDWQRELFKQVFGAVTYERYGAREMGTLASETDCHHGLHIFEPTYVIEVVNQQGRAVAPGEMGELVITDLCNLAMPLIRYRTGDMITLDDSPCSCDCTWRRISSVGGRILDLVSKSDGSRVAGQVILDILRDATLRCRIQIRQRAVNSFVIQHLPTDTVGDSLRGKVLQTFRTYLGGEVNVAYETVNELTHDKSGKYRWFINELNRNLTAS